MESEKYSTRLLESAVNEFAKLPGVGKKTALRFALHLLKQESDEIGKFGETLLKLKQEIIHCKFCHNISDKEVCDICADPGREDSIICVVENIKDVMSIENTHQFKGKYHVLGGIISPMDGIGPADLTVNSLIERVNSNHPKEIIIALSTTMEGDTTSFYLYKKLRNNALKITTLARGVAFGDELEYADELTLGRSIINRTVFEPETGIE